MGGVLGKREGGRRNDGWDGGGEVGWRGGMKEVGWRGGMKGWDGRSGRCDLLDLSIFLFFY